jgi:copper chaperone CopZ
MKSEEYMKKTLLLSAMMLTAAVGLAKDIKTAIFTTNPEMHCESCENKIKGNLRFEKGIKSIKTDLKSKTVTIQYDADKTNVQNIIKGFKKIKYEAKKVKS